MDNKQKNKKVIQKFFKDKGLQIILKCNLKIVCYLDVTSSLNDSIYRPFHKPNEETTDIHVRSDHLRNYQENSKINWKKNYPVIFNKGNIWKFERLLWAASTAMRIWRKLNYTEENNEIIPKSRKSIILWFNSPYSKSVKTNIGKFFLRLISKHFPPTHKYRKIFNKNNIKISYSYMSNIKSKVSIHNKKVLN